MTGMAFPPARSIYLLIYPNPENQAAGTTPAAAPGVGGGARADKPRCVSDITAGPSMAAIIFRAPPQPGNAQWLGNVTRHRAIDRFIQPAIQSRIVKVVV